MTEKLFRNICARPINPTIGALIGNTDVSTPQVSDAGEPDSIALPGAALPGAAGAPIAMAAE